MYADPEGGASDLSTDGYFYSAAALTATENNLCPSGFHVPNRMEVLTLNTASIAAFAEGSAALGDAVDRSEDPRRQCGADQEFGAGGEHQGAELTW